MKELSAAAKNKRKAKLLAACEAGRQQCNQLTDEERRRFRELGLRMIYSPDAKTPARSR
jgi:hypothetical protein